MKNNQNESNCKMAAAFYAQVQVQLRDTCEAGNSYEELLDCPSKP